MNTKPFFPAPLVVTRVADGQWHVLEDDLVVGRGHCVRRPDGRRLVSIDAWHDAGFDRLARAMLTDLPAPLYTLVDEADVSLTKRWERAGFTIRRREREFVVPASGHADPLVPPPGVRVVPAGAADADLLLALDRAIRSEVAAGPGWRSMPAEIRPHPGRLDPARYVVAAAPDRYLGLVRLVTATRQPRIGLIAVLAGDRRRGVALLLLSHVLGTLHRSGIAAASAEVDESNTAALALFERVGARLTGSNLELAR